MSYILDNKTNLGSIVIPTGSSATVTVYNQFVVNPLGDGTTHFGVYDTGNINIGNRNAKNNLLLDAGVDFHFVQITDTLVNYDLTNNDYAVEIISDSINTVTLPTALNNGGRTYIISRGSNNNDLILQCQTNENIDSRPLLQLTRKHVHLKVMSNGQDSWYIV